MSNRESVDCVVIGAGLAGLSCALEVARAGGRVVVLDAAETIGTKFIATVGDEDPLSTTDMTVDRFHGRDARFVTDALHLTDAEGLREWWGTLGIELADHEHYRMVTSPQGAVAAFVALTEAVEDAGATILPSHKVTSVAGSSVTTADTRFKAKHIVLACGGPNLGGSGFGAKTLNQMDATVREQVASHAPLLTDAEWLWSAEGVWMDVRATVEIAGSAVAEAEGSMLIEEGRVSGEVVYNLSRHVARADGPVELVVNFFPNQTGSEVDQWLRDTLGPRTKERVIQALDVMLPTDLARSLMERAGIKQKLRVREMDQRKRDAIRVLFTETRIPVQGTVALDEALATSGGVNPREVDPRSMALRNRAGVYVVGSLLDLDYDWGGVGQHWAVASGRLAGQTIARALASG